MTLQLKDRGTVQESAQSHHSPLGCTGDKTPHFPVTHITHPGIRDTQFYQTLYSSFPGLNMRWTPEDENAIYLFNGDMPIGKLHTGNNHHHPTIYEGRLAPLGPRRMLILRHHKREDHNNFPFDVQRETIDSLCRTISFSSKGFEKELKEKAEDLAALARYKIDGLCEAEILELEERMRPARDPSSFGFGAGILGRDSFAGFLDQTERLRDVIEADSAFLSTQGIRHEYLGGMLKTLVDLAEARFSQILRIHGVDAYFAEQNNGVIVNTNYRVRAQGFQGYQHCPWCDIALKNYPGKERLSENRLYRHATKYDYTITNERTARSINLSGLLPHLIRDHHFFEGNTSYRLEPKDALAVLELNRP